jgi:radical SAM protein with 4Fe4S-binding SPASM domain
MLNRDNLMALELGRQTERLKYIRTTVDRKTFCDFPPRRIFFEPTNTCNANCGHCVHDGQMTRAKGMIKVNLVKDVLEDVKDWNRCTEICLFQQGEPLLHPDILELVRLCSKEYDFFTKMNTNGIALTKELSEGLIHNCLDYLVFSLDAITPATYEKIKRRDKFYKVINNILDYLEIWGELDTGEERSFIACDVNLLEEDANRPELEMAKELLNKLPIGHIATYQLHNFTGPVEEVNATMDDNWGLPRAKWPCCNTPWDIVGIRWNGDVVACIYDFDSRSTVGNVKKETLRDIWNGERMQAFRQAILDRDYEAIEGKGPLCSTCSVMWQKEYQLPEDFHKELGRMEGYLVAAVDRVARRYERTDLLLEKHKYLKENRQEWLDSLAAVEEKLSKGGK